MYGFSIGIIRIIRFLLINKIDTVLAYAFSTFSNKEVWSPRHFYEMT